MKTLNNSGISKYLIISLIAVAILSLSSCYSVRVANRSGIFERSVVPNQDVESYYTDKSFFVIDTTISTGPHDPDFTIFDCDRCKNGIYSVEYEVTLGYALLNMITFGTCKKVDVKIVCIKEGS